MVTVHPEISHVSHSAAGLLGGYPLTIKGKGFEHVDCHRNKVSVAGVPCTVTACAKDELVCTLQPFQDNPEQHHTPAGTHLRTWNRYVGWPFNPDTEGAPSTEKTEIAALQGLVQTSITRYGSEVRKAVIRCVCVHVRVRECVCAYMLALVCAFLF